MGNSIIFIIKIEHPTAQTSTRCMGTASFPLKSFFITVIFKKHIGSAAFSQHREGLAKYMALPDNYVPLKSCARCTRSEKGLERNRSRAWLACFLFFFFSFLFLKIYFVV